MDGSSLTHFLLGDTEGLRDIFMELVGGDTARPKKTKQKKA